MFAEHRSFRRHETDRAAQMERFVMCVAWVLQRLKGGTFGGFLVQDGRNGAGRINEGAAQERG